MDGKPSLFSLVRNQNLIDICKFVISRLPSLIDVFYKKKKSQNQKVHGRFCWIPTEEYKRAGLIVGVDSFGLAFTQTYWNIVWYFQLPIHPDVFQGNGLRKFFYFMQLGSS